MGLAGMIGEMVMRCDKDLVGRTRRTELGRDPGATARRPGARSPS